MADHGPARTMLEHLKTFADAWGFDTIEQAADIIDKMSARKEAKEAALADGRLRLLAPGPTRTQ